MTSLVQVCNMALARLGAHQAISSLNEQSNLAAQCRIFLDQARRAALAEFDWPFAKVLIPLVLTNNAAPPPWMLEYARPACIRVRGIAILPAPPQPVPAVIAIPGPIQSGSASDIDFGGPYWPQGGPAYQGLSQPSIGVDPSPTVIPFTTGAVPVLTIGLASQTEYITMGGGGGSGGGGGECVSGGGGGYDTGQPTITPVTVTSAIGQPGGAQQVIWTNAANAGAWCTLDVTDPNAWEPGFLNVLSWFLAAEIAVNVTGSAAVQQAMMQGAQAALGKAAMAEGNEETQIASWNAEWIDVRDGYAQYGYGRGGY